LGVVGPYLAVYLPDEALAVLVSLLGGEALKPLEDLRDK
jgi:hypothetical protein